MHLTLLTVGVDSYCRLSDEELQAAFISDIWAAGLHKIMVCIPWNTLMDFSCLYVYKYLCVSWFNVHSIQWAKMCTSTYGYSLNQNCVCTKFVFNACLICYP